MDASVNVAVVVAYGVLLLTGAGVCVWLVHREHNHSQRWDARARRLSLRPIQGRDVLLLVSLVFGLVSLAVVGMQASGMTEDDLMTAKGVMIQSLGLHWGILGSVALILRGRRVRWRRVFGFQGGRLGGDLWRGVVGYLAMMPLVFVFATAYKLMLKTLGVDLDMQEVARVLTEDAPVVTRAYLLLLGVFLGPLAEELLFRGMVFPVLARRVGPFLSMIIMSLIFASIHFHLPSFLPLFVVSIAFTMGYIYSGSIAVPVVMHMLFNGINLVVFELMQGAG